MKNKKDLFSLTSVLFITYMVLLVWIILFKFSCSINEIINLDKIRRINLIPFYDPINIHFHYTEMIENVLIFIPFGIYLKMLNKENKKIIIYGLLLSLALELSQFVFSIGATDITDIITNTLGTTIGVYGYVILEKVFKNKEKINKVLQVLALVATIMFLSLMLILKISN